MRLSEKLLTVLTQDYRVFCAHSAGVHFAGRQCWLMRARESAGGMRLHAIRRAKGEHRQYLRLLKKLHTR